MFLANADDEREGASDEARHQLLGFILTYALIWMDKEAHKTASNDVNIIALVMKETRKRVQGCDSGALR